VLQIKLDAAYCPIKEVYRLFLTVRR